MLTLIFVLVLALAIISYRQLKKGNEFCAAALFLCSILGIIILTFNIMTLCELIDNVDTPQKYAEAQEKVVSLQLEIQDLKDSYSEKDADTFVAEYNDLAKQLEEAENYIKENQHLVEEGLSTDRFLLYFGG